MEQDIVVIGGGPGGATAAILLKQELPGARVMLFERDVFPRHHIGESMLPESNLILARLGVVEAVDAAGFQRKGGATFNWCEDQVPFMEHFTKEAGWTTDPSGLRVPRHSWQVRRAEYDAILLDRAREAGVEVHAPAAVKSCTPRPGGLTVHVETAEGAMTLSPKYVIDASGMSRVLARNLSIPRSEAALGDLAFYTYFSGFKWNEAILGRRELSQIFHSITPKGWMWFIPISEEVVSCGVVTRRDAHETIDSRTVFEQELARAPHIAAMLEGAVECDEYGDANNATLRAKRNWCALHERTAGEGWFLVGDAACFVDPILSSGTCVAHNTGLAAANAILTLERHPEIDAHGLVDAYNAYVLGLFSGFQTMASWWYDQREKHISQWFKIASGLTAHARTHSDRDDLMNFVTLISGYLADHRFANLGIGFGMEGMRQVFAGMDMPAEVQETFASGTADRAAPISQATRVLETTTYLATDPVSSRWWALPEMHFGVADGESIVYRPPIPEPWKTDAVERLTAIHDAVWDAVDGERGIEEIVRCVRRSLSQDDRVTHRVANTIITDLLRIRVLAVTSHDALLGAEPSVGAVASGGARP